MSKIIFSVVILAIISGCLCKDSLFDTQANAYLKNYEISREEFVTFALAANEGFGFFYNLPNFDKCVMDDPKITSIAEDILDIINGLNIKNAINVVRDVITNGLLMIDTISKQSEICKKYAGALRSVFDRLTNKTRERSYRIRLLYHSMTNMASITYKVIRTVRAFRKKDFENSGVSGGELMKFIFFWGM
jgi:hypothetical protein